MKGITLENTTHYSKQNITLSKYHEDLVTQVGRQGELFLQE